MVELRACLFELPTASRTIEALELRQERVGSPWRIGRCQVAGRGAGRMGEAARLLCCYFCGTIKGSHAVRHAGVFCPGQVHHVGQVAIGVANPPHVAR